MVPWVVVEDPQPPPPDLGRVVSLLVVWREEVHIMMMTSQRGRH